MNNNEPPKVVEVPALIEQVLNWSDLENSDYEAMQVRARAARLSEDYLNLVNTLNACKKDGLTKIEDVIIEGKLIARGLVKVVHRNEEHLTEDGYDKLLKIEDALDQENILDHLSKVYLHGCGCNPKLKEVDHAGDNSS